MRLDEMLEAAHLARARAHAPYSKFQVGVALLAEDGNIYAGCNIENTSYPEGWCAETTAISNMVMGGGQVVMAVVVVADHTPPITPCGGCRQRLKEFGTAETRIHSADLDGIKQSFTLAELLPAAFDLGLDK